MRPRIMPVTIEAGRNRRLSKEAHMSDATLQAVHDAIAAHIADVNEDDPEFLTEWVFVASAAISADPDQTSYYVYDSQIPAHHSLGLLHYGKIQVQRGIEGDPDD